MELQEWLHAHIPEGWFTGPPELSIDREEIIIVGELPAGGDGAEVERFRETTRRERMRLAAEAERRFLRKVSWGVRLGDQVQLFSTLSTPVMTRLRMRERQVLDTLVDAGVARSRSEALAWCVRLVGEKQHEWLRDLRVALSRVEEVRGQGPR